jgi:hypothetical protein
MIGEAGDDSALTLRGMARRVGIAAPSIYRHFPDVDELNMAVVQRAFADFARARDAASGDGDDPAARLLARCRAYTAFALANPGPYRYLFSQHAPTGDPARPPVDLPVFQALAESIRRCQQAGLVLLRLNAPGFPWPGPSSRWPTRPWPASSISKPRRTSTPPDRYLKENCHASHPASGNRPPATTLAGLAAAALVSAVIPAAAGLAFLISLAARRPLVAVAARRWPWLTRRPAAQPPHRTLSGLTAAWGIGLLAAAAVQGAGALRRADVHQPRELRRPRPDRPGRRSYPGRPHHRLAAPQPGPPPASPKRQLLT